MGQDVLNQIKVTDEAISLLALRSLVNSNDADTIHIVQEGQTTTTLKGILNKTSLNQVLDMTKDVMEVHVTVNVDKLNAVMKKIKIIGTEQNAFEWAIANGASNSLLMLLFPSLADNIQIARLRKVLIPNNTGFTRKTVIKVQSIKEQIHTKWHVLNNSLNMSLVEKFRALHGHFSGQYELNMLYAVLKEYEDI